MVLYASDVLQQWKSMILLKGPHEYTAEDAGNLFNSASKIDKDEKNWRNKPFFLSYISYETSEDTTT